MSRRAYARVYWMTQDVLDMANEHEVSLTRDAAREILESIEKRLAEAMTSIGWNIVEDAILQVRRSSGDRVVG